MRSCPGATTVACSFAALASAAPTLAQEPADLDYVTVYAQRRAALAQEVPMSLAVLTGEEMESAGVHDIGALATAIPGLDMQSSAGAVTTTLRIRRVGNLGNIPTFEPAVGLFVDGAFRSRSLLGTGDFLDVDHVEVLSGPQGALYGKNASAGVVAVYTREPGSQFLGEAEISGGAIDAPQTAGLGRVKVSLGGPLSPSLGGSLAAAYSGHEPTLMNALPGAPDGNDQARATLRGQLLWTGAENLKLRLIAGHMQQRDRQGESDVYFAPGADSTRVATALQQLEGVAPCPDNVPRNRVSCFDSTNELDLEASDLTLSADYRFDNGWTLSSLSSWDRYESRRTDDDAVQMFAPLAFYRDSEQGESVQQELRLASAEAARVDWLAGIFYYRNDYQRGLGGSRPMFGPDGPLAFSPLWQTQLGVPLAIPGQLGLHDSTLDSGYFSVFGQVSWPLGERLDVTGAVRWQSESKRAAINNSVTVPGASVVSVVLAPSASPDGAPVNGSVNRSTDYLTWSLTPRYRFSDELMIYLTAARSGKSGGFNTGFGNAPLSAREFDDEVIDHLEAGLRTNLPDTRIQLSAAAFQTRYHDYQDAAFVSAQFSVGNAGLVDLTGAEFEGTAEFGSGTTVKLAASLADLTYVHNTTGKCYPGRPPDGSLPGSCDLGGEHPVNAPLWVVNGTLQQQWQRDWGTLTARLDASWTDRYNTSFSADPRLVQPAHLDLGLRVGASFADRYEFILWADNLLDEKVSHLDTVLNLFDDASYQSFMTAPRSWGLTLRMTF